MIRPRTSRAGALLCVCLAALALAACSSSSGAVPAVASPTDQSVEPVISADSAPPPSTVVIKDLVVGTGATATASNSVFVMYVGALYSTGSDFDRSTWAAKMPTSFPLDEVVPGFAQGVEGMKVGGRREIVIPAVYGYGDNPPQGIPVNATLVFVVDLKSLS